MKKIIQEISGDEFKDPRSSLPPPNFKTIFEEHCHENKYRELVLNIINDSVEFSKFGSKMLEIASEIKHDSVVHKIFHEIFHKIKDKSTDKESNDKIEDGESTDKINELQN